MRAVSGRLTANPVPWDGSLLRNVKIRPDINRGLRNENRQRDPQTVFFVNLDSDDKGECHHLIQAWQAWCSAATEGTVQQLVDAEVLPSDDAGAGDRAKVRAQLFHQYIKDRQLFGRVWKGSIDHALGRVPKQDLHKTILQRFLHNLQIPESALEVLENVILQIEEVVKTEPALNRTSGQHFWIMLTKYHEQQATVRAISFQITPGTVDYVRNKERYDMIEMLLDFEFCDVSPIDRNLALLNNDRGVREIIDKGMDLVSRRTTDVQL